jgi:hypothetical protein
VSALALQADTLVATVNTLLPNGSGIDPALARTAALAVSEQAVQLYVSCNPARNESTRMPLLNSSFWTVLPDVKALQRVYTLDRALGVWGAQSNLSAVTCLLYQARCASC